MQRVSYPREVSSVWSRSGSRSKPAKKKAVKVAAGGHNSIFVIEDSTGKRTVNEVLCAGEGLWGQLGNGTYNHIQNFPVRIKPLSGLLEWDDATQSVKPICYENISIGATHVAAVFENVYREKENGVEYGKDLMCWGMNTDYQLNTSRDVKNNEGVVVGREKRKSNTSSPAYADPLPYEGADQSGRMQLAGKGATKIKAGPGAGKEVVAEQAIVCGNCTTGVYTKLVR